MKQIVAATLLFLAFNCQVGLGQLDPYPDGFGVFFDEEALINATGAEMGQMVHAYLIGTRSSWTGYGVGWWCYTLVFDYVDDWIPYGPLDGVGFPFEAVPRGGGVNIWDEPEEGENWLVLHVVFDEPFPVAENTVFCDLLLPVTITEPLGVFQFIDSRLSVEKVEGESHHFDLHYPSLYSMPPFAFFVAAINSEVIPIKTESHTWSEVKSLDR